ncbi:hypothetical protein [Paracraurococcus ruber]|uniref:Uncharacterized protein n=1 Tax=Paracraurococcus ruber TaxID=77675 RepID=A0ABS1CZN5_9PROT|nr:hypothetical protein [Paracraurococcus ruber]MBK1659863.1 hypothetical protein [Paracraurococcus ruber]TDG28964.1 hypothetical protein E2C05_19135 [Paracraurococcus ruber]
MTDTPKEYEPTDYERRVIHALQLVMIDKMANNFDWPEEGDELGWMEDPDDEDGEADRVTG